ncbi:MAG: hypothetical protein GC151_07875 [Betaproteobacteria bacterium]|nr:hypothetical protein [Betaproteobacteria bacterium]
MQHEGPIAGIAAHGALVATAGYDNRIILWDDRTRTSVARSCHDHLVNDCRFSADGRWLASASSDCSARIWSVPDLRLRAVLGGHEDDVDMAVFSPDGRRIATCALDRAVRVFDPDGRGLHVMHGHTGNVLSLAWSRDGRRLVSSGVDGTVRCWNADDGSPEHTIALGVRTDTVELAPDGTVFTGDDRGRIGVIGSSGPRFVQAHEAGVKKIVLDSRRRTIVSLSYDRSLAVWRLAAPDRLEEVSRSSLPDGVWARAASVTDDGRVVTGTFGRTYAAYDPRCGEWDLSGVCAGPAINAVLGVGGRTYTVGDAGVVAIDGEPASAMGSLCNFLVAAGHEVYTGGQAGHVFDAHGGTVLHTHHSPLNCGTSFLVDGRWHVAIGTYTGEILVFGVLADGGLEPVATIRAFDSAVKGLCSGDGLLFSVCASTEIAWHRVGDWSVVKRRPRAHERIANAGCALGAGRFASVGRDRTLRIWGGDSDEVHASSHPNSVKCMAVDARRTSVLTGSYGGTLALFDLSRRVWTSLRRPTTSGISSITWDEAGNRFLAASYDGHVYPVAA